MAVLFLFIESKPIDGESTFTHPKSGSKSKIELCVHGFMARMIGKVLSESRGVDN